MEELIAYLNTVWPLSDGCADYLRSHVKFISVKKKHKLLVPGHISKTLYFIVKGLLRAYKMKDEKEVSTWFLMEGGFIVSISSYYKQVESREYIEALENSDLFYLSHNEMEHCYANYGEFNAIGRILTQDYLVLWDELRDGILMKSSRERYDWMLKEHPMLIQRVPQKLLASWLDMTEVSLSKVKS